MMLATTGMTMMIAKCKVMCDPDDNRHYDDDSKVHADV